MASLSESEDEGMAMTDGGAQTHRFKCIICEQIVTTGVPVRDSEYLKRDAEWEHH